MPGKHTPPPRNNTGGKGYGVSVGVQATTTPCGDSNRPVTDVAGRLNDLINCYLMTGAAYAAHYVPLIILAIILIVIMLLAAKKILEV